jgi:hypothetical protein
MRCPSSETVCPQPHVEERPMSYETFLTKFILNLSAAPNLGKNSALQVAAIDFQIRTFEVRGDSR